MSDCSHAFACIPCRWSLAATVSCSVRHTESCTATTQTPAATQPTTTARHPAWSMTRDPPSLSPARPATLAPQVQWTCVTNVSCPRTWPRRPMQSCAGNWMHGAAPLCWTEYVRNEWLGWYGVAWPLGSV